MASWAGSWSAQYDNEHGLDSTKSRSVADTTVFSEDQYPNLVLERKDMEASDTLIHVPAVFSMLQQLKPDYATIKKMVPFLTDKGFDSHTITSAIKKYLTDGLAKDMLSNFNEADSSKSGGGGSSSSGSSGINNNCSRHKVNIENRGVSAAFLSWFTFDTDFLEFAKVEAGKRMSLVEQELQDLLQTSCDTNDMSSELFEKCVQSLTEDVARQKRYYAKAGVVTASICKDIVRPLTSKFGFCRFVELESIASLKSIGNGCEHWIGEASYFVSHAWGGQWLDLVRMIIRHSNAIVRAGGDPPIYWIDIFAVNQWKNTLGQIEDMPPAFGPDLGGFYRVLNHTKKLIFAIGSIETPLPLGRSWCLYELWVCQNVNADVRVMFTKESEYQMFENASEFDKLSKKVDSIDLEQAEAGRPEDKIQILEHVVATSGGVVALNQTTKEVLFISIVKAFDRELYILESRLEEEDENETIKTINVILQKRKEVRDIAARHFPTLLQFHKTMGVTRWSAEGQQMINDAKERGLGVGKKTKSDLERRLKLEFKKKLER